MFAVVAILVGLIVFFSQQRLSEQTVEESTQSRASAISKNVFSVIDTYPANDWLLRYWYEHYDQMDIEYDTDFRASTATEQKCWLFGSHQPDIKLRYVNTSELEALIFFPLG